MRLTCDCGWKISYQAPLDLDQCRELLAHHQCGTAPLRSMFWQCAGFVFMTVFCLAILAGALVSVT